MALASILGRLFSPGVHTARPVSRADGPHKNLLVALIADDFTRTCLEHECRVINVTPQNYETALAHYKPDLLFVESAWFGYRRAWQRRIASYPDRPDPGNADLVRVVEFAKDRGVPAVFWNKEDPVHFERFIDSARLFDVIFTVDANSVDRYKRAIGRPVRVHPLMFGVSRAVHNFTGIGARRPRACFVGSYSRHIHDTRRARQKMLLEAAATTLPLDIYDRNSDRLSDNYRYPYLPNTVIHSRVRHEKTASLYKKYLVSLNVNTVDDSDTMFSRRLVEIIACGGLAVTTPARAAEKWFREYCYIVDSADEAKELFARLKRDGYSTKDLEMMREGASLVARQHTYTQRLDTVLEVLRTV